jgi:iron complex transport system ATP-binding protein
MTLLETRGLTLQAGSRLLVQGLDWKVEPGQLWCVLGPNGVGKTTLLHALCGLRQPVAGAVLINDRPIATTPPDQLARLRGLLPQQQFDAFSHTVLDTVLVGRAPYRIGRQWDSEDDRAIAHAALRRLGLEALAARDVLTLSGGERQRVALAALLAQAPPLMLLDEPTSHQDVGHQLALMGLMRELLDTHAVVMSCHDINLAARHATHALLLSGTRHWIGTVDAVLGSDNLQAAFGCRFEKIGNYFVAVEADLADGTASLAGAS